MQGAQEAMTGARSSGGHGGAGSSGGHGGAGSSGGHGGAGSSGGHGGAGSSGGHGRCKELRRPWRCRELRRPWQVVFHGRGLVPRPGHSSRNPSTPPKKISLGKLGGIRSPPGLDRQDKTGTGQPSRAKQTGSPPGLSSEAEASFWA